MNEYNTISTIFLVLFKIKGNDPPLQGGTPPLQDGSPLDQGDPPLGLCDPTPHRVEQHGSRVRYPPLHKGLFLQIFDFILRLKKFDQYIYIYIPTRADHAHFWAFALAESFALFFRP
jgi:hypothetical protein